MKKIFKKLFCLVCLYLLAKFFWKCPIKYFFHIDCPGCGLTRAILAAARFDFVLAWNLHPLFWLIGGEILYLCFFDKYKFDKKIEFIVSIITIVLLVVIWIIRKF